MLVHARTRRAKHRGRVLPPPPDVLVHILPEPVLLLHQPVDQLVHRRFELRRRVADHPLLELLAHALALDQRAHVRQPYRLVEERVAPVAHLQHDRFRRALSRCSNARVISSVCAATCVSMFSTVRASSFSRSCRLAASSGVLDRQPLHHAQRRQQLQPRASLVVERAQQIIAHRAQAAALVELDALVAA